MGSIPNCSTPLQACARQIYKLYYRQHPKTQVVEMFYPIREERPRALVCVHVRLGVQALAPIPKQEARHFCSIDNKASVCL